MIEELLWHQIVASVPIVCVDVVVVRDGKALLVLRSDAPARGQWWIPGGRLMKSESLAGCAWRKAVQEVGLDCRVGPVVHRGELCFADGPGGRNVHAVTTCFLLVPKDDRPVVLDGHHRDYTWVEDPAQFYVMGEDVERVELHPYVLKCLEGAGL